jgi:hypothetical protein
MARPFIAVGLLALASCVSPPGAAPTTGELSGVIDPSGASTGNGFVFLYAANNPPLPKGTGQPVSITGVPGPRLFGLTGPNADYLFAQVDPGAYLARAVVDVRGLLDPLVDVMAQPFAGDFDFPPASVEVAAGEVTRQNLIGGVAEDFEPPVFEVDSLAAGQVFGITTDTGSIAILHLHTAALSFSDPSRSAFVYGPATSALITDGGLATTYPQVFVERIAQPDDGPNLKDASGNPLEIVLAATLEPDPESLDKVQGSDTLVDGLWLAILPEAYIVVGTDAAGNEVTQRLPSLPLGSYQISLIAATGQYWQVPNGLGPGEPLAFEHGGPYDSQGVKIQVIPGDG